MTIPFTQLILKFLYPSIHQVHAADDTVLLEDDPLGRSICARLSATAAHALGRGCGPAGGAPRTTGPAASLPAPVDQSIGGLPFPEPLRASDRYVGHQFNAGHS